MAGGSEGRPGGSAAARPKGGPARATGVWGRRRGSARAAPHRPAQTHSSTGSCQRPRPSLSSGHFHSCLGTSFTPVWRGERSACRSCWSRPCRLRDAARVSCPRVWGPRRWDHVVQRYLAEGQVGQTRRTADELLRAVRALAECSIGRPDRHRRAALTAGPRSEVALLAGQWVDTAWSSMAPLIGQLSNRQFGQNLARLPCPRSL